MIDKQNDQKLRLIVSGISNFVIESYYPESEFSMQTSASYSKFLDKIKGLGEFLAGDAVGYAEKTEQLVNAARSTYVGKKYWNPAYDTSTFDSNEPITFTIPFVFSAENAAGIDDNIKGTTYSEKNLNRIRKLMSLTAPSRQDENTLVLPGPYIGSKSNKDIANKEDGLMSRLGKTAASAWSGTLDASRQYHTSVSFQIGNWFRVDNVIVKNVDAKIHPWLDRFQHFPFYMECDVELATAYPPTVQDIQSWFLTQTNKT